MPDKSFVELADAQINWNLGKEDDCWVVNTPDNEQLFIMPKCIVEPQHASALLRFAREFELKAFNTGIQFGKNEKKTEISLLKNLVTQLEIENARLAEALERHITGEG